MDIFAHGLWAGATAKTVNLKATKKKLSVKLMAFWGVFPDLFAFSIPFIWMLLQVFIGGASFSEMRPPQEPAPVSSSFVFQLAHSLYNISHSIPVFVLLFFAVYFIFRRPIWELCGILVHIITDIPSHSYEFFPTPFLWPISDFKIDGISWGTPSFMLINYSLIVLIYSYLYFKNKSQTNAYYK